MTAAEKKIEVLTKNAEGELETEPFSDGEESEEDEADDEEEDESDDEEEDESDGALLF